MKVAEAKELVLDLIGSDPQSSLLGINTASPNPRDPNMFTIGGKVARPIHHFDGWFAPINLDWFVGSFDPPVINQMPFHWYVFAIPKERTRQLNDHYFLCDFLQMREWVLEFTGPMGNDHRDHKSWRSDFRFFPELGADDTAYFRWGDEPLSYGPLKTRVISLDNAGTLIEPKPSELRVGQFGRGGESADHRLLKLYVASNPAEFGLSDQAVANVEYSFVTGDRVDVMFENHLPERTVVEIEVEGDNNLCIGIHQAVKYKSLMEIEFGEPLLSSKVGSLVVAYDVNYPRAQALAHRYEIPMQSVAREAVFGV